MAVARYSLPPTNSTSSLCKGALTNDSSAFIGAIYIEVARMLLAAILSNLEIYMHHTLRIEAILTYALTYGIANHCKQEKERDLTDCNECWSVGNFNHLHSNKVKQSLISLSFMIS